MALEPGASVKSKYDLTRSRFEYRDSYELVHGTNLIEEAQLMIAGGVAVQQAAVSAGAAAEVPLGVALNASILGVTFTAFEAFTVPAAPGPYTVQLGNTNLVDAGGAVGAEIYAWDVTNGNVFVHVAAPPAAINQYSVNALTGVMTFDPAGTSAGVVGWARYRWNLTAIQAREILRESAIGRGSDATFEKIIVGRGHCRIFTTMYDCNAAWTLNFQTDTVGSNDNSPCLGPGGVWSTTAALNAVLPAAVPLGRVISLPTADDPYLGIEYHIAR